MNKESFLGVGAMLLSGFSTAYKAICSWRNSDDMNEIYQKEDNFGIGA